MSSERDRWATLQRLFEAVLEQPLDLRDEWLSREVDDEALRQELKGLLRAHEEPGGLDRVSDAVSRMGARSGETVLPRKVGPYAIEAVLGEGGMALVYRARRSGRKEGPPVAVKLLRTEVDSRRTRERFETEQAVLRRLRHPAIARFQDHGVTEDGRPYLVTELVEGLRIDHFCREQELSTEPRVELVLQLCEALAHAHGLGVVHRDIKPQNLLVDPAGRLRVLDFGIAKVLSEGSLGELARKTSTGIRTATVRYASPEQILGGAITERSDIHQVGGLLYLLVVGDALPLASKVSAGAKRRAGKLATATHPALDAAGLDRIVARACSEDPEDRYPTAAALADDLSRWMAERMS